MNAYLNYLLEANIGLCLFLVLYNVLLKNETQFALKRGYLLLAIIASITLPLFHINTTENIVPSLGNVVPANWLPEVTITANGTAVAKEAAPHYDIWFAVNILYNIGVIIFLTLFLLQLSRLLIMLYKASAYWYERFLIIESPENRSAFSFFRFIFIGQVGQLSLQEKQQIIEHERVHAEQLHSIDILLVNLLSIFFWFNPCIRIYKKIFVQLHEFEADARAVANRDMNVYCSLLAKVALLSADFTLANHFSNSLTVKRIEMMRTIKSKIKIWKIAAIAAILPAFFFVISCQDQVMNEATDIAKNSTMVLDLPEQVQQRLDEMKKANPDKKFIVIEPDENSASKAEDMKKKTADLNPNYITSMDVMKNITDKTGAVRSFIIIEYNEAAQKVAEASKEGEVFMIVEQSATFDGGPNAMGKFIQEHLVYPTEARQQGIEGKVFVQFIVNKDGSLSDLLVKKGVDPRLDAAALAVVQALPKWNPGQQNGLPVRQQFVLPINFDLDSEVSTSGDISAVLKKLQVATASVVEKNSGRVVTGKVRDENGNPLPGTNVLIVGQTKGTTTDANGEFQIEVESGSGQLAVSFIGYESALIPY
jgi:TonB family protein